MNIPTITIYNGQFQVDSFKTTSKPALASHLRAVYRLSELASDQLVSLACWVA